VFDRVREGPHHEPGSVKRLILAVDDVDAARGDVSRSGDEVSAVFHLAGGTGFQAGIQKVAPIRATPPCPIPEGNEWLLQEIKTRLPGREWVD
jgi:hypothetical protein